MKMTDPTHIEAIETEYKQIENTSAWNQIYQVIFFTLSVCQKLS